MQLSKSLTDHLFEVVFDPSFPGFCGATREIPHGDGRVDASKLYSHVKYDRAWTLGRDGHRMWSLIFARAEQISATLDLPVPSRDRSVLRFLKYPPGVGGHAHTDFSLFTINVWRSDPLPGPRHEIHFGELLRVLGFEVSPTPHHVPALPHEQRSIVFFAMPKYDEGDIVDLYMKDRYPRSRTTVGA